MIRYAHIYRQILDLYRNLPRLAFPLEPLDCLARIPRCRAMSYHQFARVSRSTLREVINLNESESGCTHYDVQRGRYLVLYNDSGRRCVPGRVRWTKAHELGHVLLGHLEQSALTRLAENGPVQGGLPDVEREADHFAGTLLSPYPLFEPLGIRSWTRTALVFGLSQEAAQNRFNGYQSWRQTRRPTAWEDELLTVARDHLGL